MTDLHAVPEHLPPLPEGEVYLGQGPLRLPPSITKFEGHATHVDHCKTWCANWFEGYTNDHYTAPLHNPVTHHILAHRVPDGVPVLPEGFLYVGRAEYLMGSGHQKPERYLWTWGANWKDSNSAGADRDGVWCPGSDYAVPIESPLARKLLGLERDTRPSWDPTPDEAPDLVIPKDAAMAMCGYGWVEELAEAGYRIEVDEHGLRGWKE